MKNKLKIPIIILLVVAIYGCLPKESGNSPNLESNYGTGRVPVNSYPFFECPIDKLPDLKDVKGILVMAFNHPSVPCYMLVIGDMKQIEQIVGFDLFDQNCQQPPVEQDTCWINKILTACQKAERHEKILSGSDCRLTFVTKQSAEMLQFDMDDERVFGKGYQSEELKGYLMELFRKHNIQP